MIQAVIQTLMGIIGAFGFALLFNVRRGKLVAVSLGAGVCWVVYLLVYSNCQDKVISLLFATMAAALISEVLARVMKAPVTILLVPILVPLIPGSDLFYTTSNLVRGDATQSAYYGSLVLKEAGAIAFGIILVPCIGQIIMKIWRLLRNILQGGKR